MAIDGTAAAATDDGHLDDGASLARAA